MHEIVHKTARAGPVWAENTPPNTLSHARTIAPAPLSMLVLFFDGLVTRNDDPHLHEHSSYNQYTLRHKCSTYNPVRCTVRFPCLTRSILSQNIRTATPLLKKLPPCVPLSRPFHLCTTKPNIFAFPFHKCSTYSPVRCTDRLPHPTRSMLSKKIRVVPPL